jgi:hypothetical protein
LSHSYKVPLLLFTKANFDFKNLNSESFWGTYITQVPHPLFFQPGILILKEAEVKIVAFPFSTLNHATVIGKVFVEMDTRIVITAIPLCREHVGVLLPSQELYGAFREETASDSYSSAQNASRSAKTSSGSFINKEIHKCSLNIFPSCKKFFQIFDKFIEYI